MPGNNSNIVRKAMEKRSWWIEIQPVHSLFNFKWQPVSSGIRFDKLGAVKQKQSENFGIGSQQNTFNITLGAGYQMQQAQNSCMDINLNPSFSDLN